jgi:hypothetical protein
MQHNFEFQINSKFEFRNKISNFVHLKEGILVRSNFALGKSCHSALHGHCQPETRNLQPTLSTVNLNLHPTLSTVSPET